MNTQEIIDAVEKHKRWLQHGKEVVPNPPCPQTLFFALDACVNALIHADPKWAEEHGYLKR